MLYELARMMSYIASPLVKPVTSTAKKKGVFNQEDGRDGRCIPGDLIWCKNAIFTTAAICARATGLSQAAEYACAPLQELLECRRAYHFYCSGWLMNRRCAMNTVSANVSDACEGILNKS